MATRFRGLDRPPIQIVIGLLLTLLALVLLSRAHPATAQTVAAQTPMVIAADRGGHAGELVVPLNKSQILRLDRPIADLLVGNPEVADVMALSDRSVYVLGKSLGSTNLSIYGRDRRLLAVLDLTVAYDVEGLKAKLFDLMPRERVEVRSAGSSLVLSGVVSSTEQVGRAMAVAERYAPGQVTNLMRVNGSQQVMLSVRIAEVSRSAARELGLKPAFEYLSGGNANFSFSTLDPLDLTRFAAGLLQVVSGKLTVDLLIDALEEKGVVKILAEPNLIALSGDTANFLAGGEFPIPVSQTHSTSGVPTITVEFKQFGVSLAFTPTVLDGDLVNLVVSPEVSQIDRSNSVTLFGLTIPGLSTRRATTTVELRDGQSFAIAGLLQSDFSDQVRGLPWVNDVPVLGALFRSSAFQRSETELVIIVTPHLVQPARAGTLRAPTDTFTPPSDVDLFLFGKAEGAARSLGHSPGAEAAPSGAQVLGTQAAGGIAGPYGHIIK